MGSTLSACLQATARLGSSASIAVGCYSLHRIPALPIAMAITTLQLKTAQNVRGLVTVGQGWHGLLRTPRAVAMVALVKG